MVKVCKWGYKKSDKYTKGLINKAGYTDFKSLDFKSLNYLCNLFINLHLEEKSSKKMRRKYKKVTKIFRGGLGV